MRARVCACVCLSAPEREEWESETEKAAGTPPGSQGYPPGAQAEGGHGGLAAAPRLEGWSEIGRLDGDAVRRGATVWVGEDVSGMSHV